MSRFCGTIQGGWYSLLPVNRAGTHAFFLSPFGDRQSKSPEDRETEKHFAPLWNFLLQGYEKIFRSTRPTVGQNISPSFDCDCLLVFEVHLFVSTSFIILPVSGCRKRLVHWSFPRHLGHGTVGFFCRCKKSCMVVEDALDETPSSPQWRFLSTFPRICRSHVITQSSQRKNRQRIIHALYQKRCVKWLMDIFGFNIRLNHHLGFLYRQDLAHFPFCLLLLRRLL